MRLEDMLKDVSGITQKVVDSNCFKGANTILENILLIQTKVNEVIKAINDGVIKGDKGDKGDKGNTGEKGDKGDTGKASESIQDNVISLDTCYSSEKTVSLFNDLKNIQGVKYGNDVGYQVCKGTHNGVVKDIKIYGKSLVNVLDVSYWMEKPTQVTSSVDVAGTNTCMIPKNIYTLCANDVVTIIPNITVNDSYNAYFQMNYTTIGGEEKLLINIPFSQGMHARVITLPDDFKELRVVFVGVYKGQVITRIFQNKGVMVIKGEHPYNFQYFKGIASVGNGNEIEVLSRKEDGNVIPPKYSIGGVNANTGEDYNQTTQYIRSDYFTLVKGRYYVKELESNPKFLYLYNLSGGYIGKKTISSQKYVDIENTCMARIDMNLLRVATYEDLNSIKVALSASENPNLVYKQDKKTILFKDTDNTWKPITNLRGFDENNCDIIDSVNNKFIEKIIKCDIDKNIPKERIRIITDYGDVTRVDFELGILNKIGSNVPILCDSFNKITITSQNTEGINVHGTQRGTVQLQIKTSKLPTKDANGVISYLTSNPFEVLIPYENPKEYELNPLFPNSYENETMISFNTGVIPCKNEFYIDSNLGSLQLETLDRLSRIEDTIYKSNVAILRGDFRSLAQMYYPSDFIKKEELPNE